MTISDTLKHNISPSKGGVIRTFVNSPIINNVPKIRCQNFNDDLRKYIDGVPAVYIPNYNLIWTCTNPGWGSDASKMFKQFNKKVTNHAFSELSTKGLVVMYADMLVESRMWRTSIPINMHTWNTLLSQEIIDNLLHEYRQMRELCSKDNDLFPDPVRIHIITPNHAYLCGDKFNTMSLDEISQIADEHCEPILYLELKRRERATGSIDNNSFQAIVGYTVKDLSLIHI